MTTPKGIEELAKEKFGVKAGERFVASLNVGKDTDCWEWQGSVGSKGYGQFFFDGKTRLAHRVVYQFFTKAKMPQDLVLDHLCRNTVCVNPKHLELVTNKVNILRGVGSPAQNARKTVCSVGHPFIGDNKYLNTKGARECRVCRKAWRAASRERRMERIRQEVAGHLGLEKFEGRSLPWEEVSRVIASVSSARTIECIEFIRNNAPSSDQFGTFEYHVSDKLLNDLLTSMEEKHD